MLQKLQKKMGRDANEGVVVICGNEKKTSIIEINCETDFVAKNKNFLDFVKEVGELNNEISSNLENLKKSKMKNNNSVEDNLVSLIAKIGEKITFGKCNTLESTNGINFIYHHNVITENVSKLGVIVSLEANEINNQLQSFGKQLSMHIAASNPLAINSAELSNDIIEKEQNIITEELKNLGKPEEIAKKISLGKINKFKEENSLITQDWVMEPKKKVKDVLKELNITNLKINKFVRIKIGE